MENKPTIAIVIPFYQEKSGILRKTLESIATQTISANLVPIIVDDGAPVSLESELESIPEELKARIKAVRQENAGAGAARNRALDMAPPDTDFVAFLDSDDCWLPHHLELAVEALNHGFDFYFCDYYPFEGREATRFERSRLLHPQEELKVAGMKGVYELETTIQYHVVKAGNVIGTSCVVYRFQPFKDLRFREEFFNGQDFFFWLDLGVLGARTVYSLDVGCECGVGVNIYQQAGWGSDHSLRRLRNEIQVWHSVAKIYQLTPEENSANNATLANLEETAIRDVIHRLLRRKKLRMDYLRDILKMRPLFPLRIPVAAAKIARERLRQQGR